jgi:hypothetical protein
MAQGCDVVRIIRRRAEFGIGKPDQICLDLFKANAEVSGQCARCSEGRGKMPGGKPKPNANAPSARR